MWCVCVSVCSCVRTEVWSCGGADSKRGGSVRRQQRRDRSGEWSSGTEKAEPFVEWGDKHTLLIGFTSLAPAFAGLIWKVAVAAVLGELDPWLAIGGGYVVGDQARYC